MGLLARVSIVGALAGCYQPSVRDCTVSCNAQSDCANGQTCGLDHFCVAPNRSCTPFADANTDVGNAPDAPRWDAAPADAPQPDAVTATTPDAAMPDAGLTIGLHIHIDGHGRVSVAGGSTCHMHDCTYNIPVGVPVTLHALPDQDQRFDRWTTLACAGQGATCMLTPFVATTVGAKFRKEEDH